MPSLGGYGADYFGELLGGGGPISVVRAVAMASQVVRVAFNQQPLNKSAAGARDGLNPANYTISAVTGQVQDVSPTVVTGLAQGPARGLGASDWGVDLGVDRPLVLGVLYRVSVANVMAALGGALGTPWTANFAGIYSPRRSTVPRKRPTWIDFANPPAKGALVVDDSGDIAPESDRVENFKKRAFRILMTAPNAFSFLKGFGAGVALMEVASHREIARIRVSAETQLRADPDCARATVQIQVTGNGVATVSWAAVLKDGSAASGSFPVNAA